MILTNLKYEIVLRTVDTTRIASSFLLSLFTYLMGGMFFWIDWFWTTQVNSFLPIAWINSLTDYIIPPVLPILPILPFFMILSLYSNSMLLTLWPSSLWPSPWFKFLLVHITYMTLLQLCHYFNSVIVCNAIEWESHITVLYVFVFVSVCLYHIFLLEERETRKEGGRKKQRGREKETKREGEGDKEGGRQGGDLHPFEKYFFLWLFQ